jgi:DNA-directed RNA polymerase sigma subunit (sigma70/sigma32)
MGDRMIMNTPREQEALKMRFGLDNGYSLTLEIEAKALRRLMSIKEDA